MCSSPSSMRERVNALLYTYSSRMPDRVPLSLRRFFWKLSASSTPGYPQKMSE